MESILSSEFDYDQQVLRSSKYGSNSCPLFALSLEMVSSAALRFTSAASALSFNDVVERRRMVERNSGFRSWKSKARLTEAAKKRTLHQMGNALRSPMGFWHSLERGDDNFLGQGGRGKAQRCMDRRGVQVLEHSLRGASSGTQPVSSESIATFGRKEEGRDCKGIIHNRKA